MLSIRRVSRAASSAALVLAGVSQARADRYYVGLPGGGTGNWNSAANWSEAESTSGGAGAPGTNDFTYLINNDALNRNVNLDVSAGIGTLYIGNSGGGVTTLYQTGFDLTTPFERIGLGLYNTGAHFQSGGTNTATELHVAGYSSDIDTVGTYSLSGGTLIANSITVGYWGDGTFQQTGGVVKGGWMQMGLFKGSTAVYNLVSGQLSRSSETIGYNGAATFTHTGGTNTIGTPQSPGSLNIGDNLIMSTDADVSHGLYTLNGASASLIVYGSEYVGYRGIGTFEQTAGSHLVTGTLLLANAGGGTRATYRMSGGSLTTLGELNLGGATSLGQVFQSGGTINVGTASAGADLLIGATGGFGGYSLNQSASPAALYVWGDERLGQLDRGLGNFTMSGGVHTIAGTLQVAGGLFELTGGALTVPTIALGPQGRFTYAGGSLNVSALSNAGSITVGLGSGRTLKVNSISIDNTTGKLDLTDNDMIVDYTGSPGTLVDDLRQDLHDGALFTTAGTSANRLGYANNTVTGFSTFGGQPVDPTSVLVKFTYAGDGDLNGQVDIADLGALATHWQSAGAWTDGDFDYNGVVDSNDLGLLASNWQAGVGNPLAPSLDAALQNLGLPVAAVPEPSTIIVVGVVSTYALTRRKAHQRRGN